MPSRERKSALAWALQLAGLAFLAVTGASAWVMSVEFPFAALQPSVWERELAHLKEMGVTHVSLSTMTNADLDGVIRIIRRLGLEADLEGPVPERLQPQMKSHGGPLTESDPQAVRISATMARAVDNERKLITSGTQAIVWTDAFDTIAPVFKPGAITLAGAEKPGGAQLRREAQLARYWGQALSGLPESRGARLTVPAEGIALHQFLATKPGASPTGLSMLAISNATAKPWKGEVRAFYPVLQRLIGLPALTVAAHDVLWMPINVPLSPGPMCTGCTGFAPPDHLVYATAELTGMEYENGILAMEFIAFSPGEAVLQLSHEPPGPLVAAGKPSVFDWDSKSQRARLRIPAGNTANGRVRIALALDAPAATAFFDSRQVLVIGETNILTAQFSPAAVAPRSRLRIAPDYPVTQDVKPQEDKEAAAQVSYRINVPQAAIQGDTARLMLEADGIQLSHTQLRVVSPLAVTFESAVAVRVAANSSVPLTPATIPVNQRSGREVVLSLRNNAPEIRTFTVALRAPGLDFSPETLTVSVGASVARDVTFRVFSGAAATGGIHEGEVNVTGAATLNQSVRFLVVPPTGAVTWTNEGFSILESARFRATFLAGRWLEMLDKESGVDSQPAGGTLFTGGPPGSLKLEELEKQSPPKQAPAPLPR